MRLEPLLVNHMAMMGLVSNVITCTVCICGDFTLILLIPLSFSCANNEPQHCFACLLLMTSPLHNVITVYALVVAHDQHTSTKH